MSAAPPKWFHSADTTAAKPVGPIDDVQLKALAKSGAITSRDFVWRTGQPSWSRAADIIGLFEPTPPLPARAWPPFTTSSWRWLSRLSHWQRVIVIGISVLVCQAIAAGLTFSCLWLEDIRSKSLDSLASIDESLSFIRRDTDALTTPKWDYQTKVINDADLDSKLSEYGNDGWDLVFARRGVDRNETPLYTLIMKRMRRR